MHLTASSTAHFLDIYRVREQVALDGDHDIVEIFRRDEAGANFVLGLEGDERVLIVEVVEELRELGVCDDSLLVLAEVHLDKLGLLQRERDAVMEARLRDDLAELVEADHPGAVGVEQLEGRPVEGIRHTQPALESKELIERYEAAKEKGNFICIIFVGV